MTDRLKDPKPDAAARANARDAIEMLDAFRNPATGDIAPVSKLAETLASISTVISQTAGDRYEYGSPEWVATRLVAEAARVLELVGDGETDRANAAARAWIARGV